MKVGVVLLLLTAAAGGPCPSLTVPLVAELVLPQQRGRETPHRRKSNQKHSTLQLLAGGPADTDGDQSTAEANKADTTSSASTSSNQPPPPNQQHLTDEQRDFCRGYLNKHHGPLLLKFVEILTPLGAQVAKANAWTGGSMTLPKASITQVNDDGSIAIAVQVAKRNQPEITDHVVIPLNAHPIPEKSRQYPTLPLVPSNDPSRDPLDDWTRRVARLCWISKHPAVSGQLTQLALQLSDDNKTTRVGELPPNLFLNQVPHNRYVRQYFYDAASQAVLDAVVLCGQGHLSSRMLVTAQFPELNPSMDSYRIGTLLEMARSIAIRLVVEGNWRVKVCVQQSMGVGIFTGLPKQLGGVSKLLQLMDWQSQPGEENEGMVGDYVTFGGVGADHVVNEQRDPITGDMVQHQDDVFLLIAPQSMVGTDSSIVPLLQDMVNAAGNRPIILLNPDLTDKVSSGGQQSVRGRQARLDFAHSFQTVYCFQNIYVSGTSYFPILGAMTKHGPLDPWVAHQRRDLLDGGEMYVPILMAETRPEGEQIMDSFER